MPTSKTFTAFNTLPGVAIGKCSEILPDNRLQCWKAADFQITLPDGTSYQKCRRHAQAELQAEIAAAASTEGVSEPAPEVAPESEPKAPVAPSQIPIIKPPVPTVTK
jgi:hypothetical protein